MDRGRRPGRRWTSPATPLQAARFARRWDALETVERVRKECSGHSGRPCGMSTSKLSEIETGKFHPTAQHIAVFCRVYGTDPEELGLIIWRTPEERMQAARDTRMELEREIYAELEAPLLLWF